MKRINSYIRHHFNEIGKAILFLLTILVLVFIFPENVKFKYEFSAEKPWMYEDLIAPFDFAILKSSKQLEQERIESAKKVIPYFQYDNTVLEHSKNKLSRELRGLFTSRYREEEVIEYHTKLNQEVLFSLVSEVYRQGVISEKEKSEYTKIYLLNHNQAKEIKSAVLYTPKTANERIIQQLSNSKAPINQALCVQALKGIISPNLIFNEDKTQKERENLYNANSPYLGMVQKGERIISKGDLVTSEKAQILGSFKKEYESVFGKKKSTIGLVIGQFILILVALLSLFFFLLLIKNDVFVETKKVALILILLILMVGSTQAIIQYNAIYLYVLPIALIPILLRVFFDVRLAIFAYVIGLMLSSIIVPNSFEFVFIQFFAGITAILSILKLSKRSQFYYSALFIFAAYVILSFGLKLIEEGEILDYNYQLLIYFAISSALTLFAYPLIFGIEKLFGFITDITLMELSNTNNPLLRELSNRAPGTFQHCMQVGNLAEEAIYEIGGNPLLVRTGALYHDIGKLFDPQFFIENQSTGFNPHEDLGPEESVQIIVGHILDGVKLAKKHKLPPQVIDFIRTHHGTQRAEYFWVMAQKESPDEDLEEDLYTYPGPTPFSKETAVLMMADSVEAASRSIDNPNEETLSNLIDSIIQKQMRNHQFDNADITLRDISKIKKIFKRKLLSIYHLRIKYPE